VRVQAQKLGIGIEIEKVADYETIARPGFLATPAFFIDGAAARGGSREMACRVLLDGASTSNRALVHPFRQFLGAFLPL
jgi:hypothetical protein